MPQEEPQRVLESFTYQDEAVQTMSELRGGTPQTNALPEWDTPLAWAEARAAADRIAELEAMLRQVYRPSTMMSDHNVIPERSSAIELAESVVRWFGFSDRKHVLWGADYNQAARDLYERACAHLGRLPLPKDQPR